MTRLYTIASIIFGFLGAAAIVVAFKYPDCKNVPEWIYDLQAVGLALHAAAPHFGLVAALRLSRKVLNRMRYLTVATGAGMYATAFNAMKELFSLNCDNSVLQTILFYTGLALITLYHYARATEHTHED